MSQQRRIGAWRMVLLAGLAGGAAEILWVALYGSVSATSGSAVARQIVASFWPAAAERSVAPALGVAIHMALALALAAAVVPLLLHFARRHGGPGAIWAGAIAALVLVWAVNFLLILPLLNPAFVTLMPHGATLASKVLFGVAMGITLHSLTRQQAKSGIVAATVSNRRP